MKAVKETKVSCAFCPNKIRKRVSFAHRMGMRQRKLKVLNGYLLITSYSAQLPICKECWGKAVDILIATHKKENDERQEA